MHNTLGSRIDSLYLRLAHKSLAHRDRILGRVDSTCTGLLRNAMVVLEEELFVGLGLARLEQAHLEHPLLVLRLA